MPAITETKKDLWAFCQNSLCRGYTQRPVAGVVIEQSWTFKELSGNSDLSVFPGVERTTLTYRFEREEDRPCPVCGEAREITDQIRPEYPAVSGYPAGESIKWFGSFVPGHERSAEVEAALARLEAAIGEQ